MARICALLLAVTLSIGAQAMAADQDTRTCALSKVIECTPDAGCGEWSIQDMALPRFVRIDIKGGTISSLDKEIARTSKIHSVEQVNNLIVMHGTELRGWSAALEEETGDLTLSASGQNEGFIVFGSCITP